MKILATPFPSLKATGDKINRFFSAVSSDIIFFFSRNHTERPSRMYRQIFSTQKVKKAGLVKEQYVIQEPDYYGNYE
jgi:hypothetical protein